MVIVGLGALGGFIFSDLSKELTNSPATADAAKSF
jgi:hypothetical protein